MKTTVIGKKGVETTGKGNFENKANGIGGNTATGDKINGLPMSKQFSVPAKQDEPKKDEPKKVEPVAGDTKPAAAIEQHSPSTDTTKAEHQTAPAAEQPKEQPTTEPTKAEVKATIKPVLNLESTLKLVEEMHRKSKQRTKLQETIKNLEGFEVELRDEADTTDTNYYTGCVLVIEDDKRNKFETKNPTIIWAVAQMVNSMCVDKLAEIEASIVLPQ